MPLIRTFGLGTVIFENFDKIPVLATGPYDYGMSNRNTEVDVPLSDERDPVLAAGPNSVLRADPDEPYPSIAARKEEGSVPKDEQ